MSKIIKRNDTSNLDEIDISFENRTCLNPEDGIGESLEAITITESTMIEMSSLLDTSAGKYDNHVINVILVIQKYFLSK